MFPARPGSGGRGLRGCAGRERPGRARATHRRRHLGTTRRCRVQLGDTAATPVVRAVAEESGITSAAPALHVGLDESGTPTRGQPVPQMGAVGIDQAVAVAGWAPELVRGDGAGVALGGVECPTEPVGAVEQADALIEQLMHRRVLRGSGRRLPGRTLWSCPPTVTVGDHGLSTAPPSSCHSCQRSLTCTDLHRIRCVLTDRFSVNGEPSRQTISAPACAGFAVGQHVDATLGDRVDHSGRVAVPASQRDVVDAEHSSCWRRRDW